MPLVTVKSRFQVTIPARLRKALDLCEGDLMEATVVDGGVLLRPMAVVDRHGTPDSAPTAIPELGIAEYSIGAAAGVTSANARGSRRPPPPPPRLAAAVGSDANAANGFASSSAKIACGCRDSTGGIGLRNACDFRPTGVC